MKILKSTLLSGAVAGALLISAGSGAQALPLKGNLLHVAPATAADSLIVKVQRRGFRGRSFRGRGFRGARPFRGRPFRGRGFRGRRGIGPGAAIGLGILGLGLAAGAAHAYPYGGGYYYEDVPRCWFERRPIYNRYGDYIGRRRIRVCH